MSPAVAVLAFLIAGSHGDAATAAPGAEPAMDGGGPAVMRRLTESQYRATIADIFAPDIPVVGRFEPGLRVHGLIAVGTSELGLSPFSIEQYDVSARRVAAEVVSPQRRDRLVPCVPKSERRFDPGCAARFVEHYGTLLFRRPLAPDETDRFVKIARDTGRQLNSFYAGLQFALVGMMNSPQFLLRIENSAPDPAAPGRLRLDAWSRATRLSYFLTGSTPDSELLRAAGAGELDSDDGLARQVDRLIASAGFEVAVRAFFADMLELDLFEDLAKDPLIYPAYNSRVAADAREATLRTIVDHLLVENGDYRELFTTLKAWLTRPLGIIYRVPVATRNGWEQAEFSTSSGRAGIQSKVAFLALHSHPGRSSPTLRGVAMREIFMCQPMPDPPADVDFTGIDDTENPALPTARDRLEAHRTQPACAGCHALMDPLGLTLENFDGIGSHRTRENDVVIDASGSLDRREFEAASGLGQALHDHPETSRCLVRKMYRFAVGREVAVAERPYVDYLNRVFADTGYRVPDLMRTIAVSKAFYAVAVPDESASDEVVAGVDSRSGDKQ